MDTFIVLCVAIVALFSAMGARGRIEALSKRIEALEATRTPSRTDVTTRTDAVPVGGAAPVVPGVTTPLVAPLHTGAPQEPGFDLIDWIKKDWLLKLGALCVLVAFGWFVSYAFIQGWIGPMGRIALGLVSGALFIVLGWWRLRTERAQGAIFTVIGATTVLMTIFAARAVYDFFTPASALALIFLTAAFVGLMSAVYKHKALAILGTILAGMAPLYVHSPTVDYVGLNAYLMAMTLGALLLVYRTGFREVTFITCITYAVYSVQHLLAPGDDRLFVFACAFATIFFLANIIGMVRRGFINTSFDTTLAFVNAMILLAHIGVYVPEVWRSLTTAAWALVFVVGAFIGLRLTKDRRPFLIYAAVSAVYIAAATAFELSGPALTLALIIESAIATLVVFALTNNRGIAEKASLVMLGSALLALESIGSPLWHTSAIHSDALVVFLAAVAFLVVGSTLQSRGGEEVRADGTHVVYHPWQQIIGGLFLVALVWLTTHAVFPQSLATMVSLVIYVVSGLSLYYSGIMSGDSRMRLVGATLLLGSIARLLLVDVWQLELAVRIMTFFAIGVMLLATAFVRKQR